MELHEFFSYYMEENELARANLINDGVFETLASLVDFKVSEIRLMDGAAPITDMVTMTEIALIRQLIDIEPPEGLHQVIYRVDDYPVLTDFQYILEAGEGRGVIHHDIVEALHKALKENHNIPAHPMYIHKNEPLDQDDVAMLDRIYRGPIYWLYDNITWRQLRRMLKRLNAEPDGHQKDDYLRHLTSIITNPKYLEGILLQLNTTDLEQIEDNVQKGFNVYEASSRWSDARNLGLLVKIHADHYVMHEAVRSALEEVSFEAVEAHRRKSGSPVGRPPGGDFNAYVLHAQIEDLDFEISREIIMPAGSNCFELHLVIQKAMGWRQKHDASFEAGPLTIDATGDALGSEGRLPSSYIQIDAVFAHHETLHYLYGEDYRVTLDIEAKAHIHRPIPKVQSHQGPAPIENIGGAAYLADTLEVLSSVDHPDYIRTYEKVRATNYRERYPVTAINNQLEKMFRKSYPITEYNIDEIE